MPGAGHGAALALPGVEPDVVVVAAGGEECGAVTQALRHLEAEHVAIEADGALEVGDLEVDVTDARAGFDGRPPLRLRHAREHTDRGGSVVLSSEASLSGGAAISIGRHSLRLDNLAWLLLK